MRAIAGMARSYNGRPELPMTVGASLLANGIPGESDVGRFASKLAPTENRPAQPAASMPPAASRPASSRMNSPSSSDWLPMPSLA